jgi:hypothetical protein
VTELDELPVEAFTPVKTETSTGWKIREIGEPTEHVDYVKRMAAEMLKGPRPPRPVVPTHFNGKLIADLLPDERKAFYFSMQPKSTQEAITRQKDRHPSEDKDFSLRPMSDDWLAVKDAKNPVGSDEWLAEITNERKVSTKEIVLGEDLRRKPRNTFGDAHDTPTLTPQMKEKAVQAFMYSKPHDLKDEEIKRITKLEEIVNTPMDPPVQKKQGFWARLFRKDPNPSEGRKFKTKYRFTESGLMITGSEEVNSEDR